MKYTSLVLLSLFLVSGTTMQGSKKIYQKPARPRDVEFVIVIPSYKNEKWAAENLASACNQKSSRPFQVICINDCSPDRTGEIMEEYVREHHLESKVKIIHNETRLGVMANWYNTIHNHIPDHKVVVNFDGDDLLANDNVLLTLEKYYSDPDVWLTYGSAKAYPSKDKLWYMSQEMPKKVFKKKELRKHPFITQHLRTFKAGLFKKIKKEDLMLENIDLAADVAFMIPMLEMCSPSMSSDINHSRFIPEILYFYRTNNPLNLFRTHADEQLRVDKRVRAQKPYQPLDSLVANEPTVASERITTKPQLIATTQPTLTKTIESTKLKHLTVNGIAVPKKVETVTQAPKTSSEVPSNKNASIVAGFIAAKYR